MQGACGRGGGEVEVVGWRASVDEDEWHVLPAVRVLPCWVGMRRLLWRYYSIDNTLISCWTLGF